MKKYVIGTAALLLMGWVLKTEGVGGVIGIEYAFAADVAIGICTDNLCT